MCSLSLCGRTLKEKWVSLMGSPSQLICKKRKDYTFRRQFNEKQLICNNCSHVMYTTQQLKDLAMAAMQLCIYLPSGECWCHMSRRQISVAETLTCMSTHKDRHNAHVVAVMQTPSPPLQNALGTCHAWLQSWHEQICRSSAQVFYQPFTLHCHDHNILREQRGRT